MKNQSKKFILFIITICMFQLVGNAQSFRKNGIGVSANAGAHKLGVSIDYQRKLGKHFGLITSFGKRGYNKKIASLHSGEIKGRILDMSIGAQLNQRENGSGFFCEAGLNFSKVKWNAIGKIRLPDPEFNPTTLAGFALAALLSGPRYDHLSAVSEQSSLNIYGKLGYRFINKAGDLSIGPFVMTQGISGPKKLDLESNYSENIVQINPQQNLKPISLGIETSIRF